MSGDPLCILPRCDGVGKQRSVRGWWGGGHPFPFYLLGTSSYKFVDCGRNGCHSRPFGPQHLLPNRGGNKEWPGAALWNSGKFNQHREVVNVFQTRMNNSILADCLVFSITVPTRTPPFFVRGIGAIRGVTAP